MSKKAHPTLTQYQHKIIYAKAYSMGVRPATVIKQFMHDGFVNMPKKEIDYLLERWDKMSEDEKRNPAK